MKQAITKTKKILAVLMCVFMLSSFAVPFAGAQDAAASAIEWTLSEEERAFSVPEAENGSNVYTLTAATLATGVEGEIKYSLCTDAAGEIAFNSIAITCKESEPVVTITNSAKKYVANAGSNGAKLFIKASLGTDKVVYAITVKNFELAVTFLDDYDEPLKTENIPYGGSAVDVASDIAAEMIIPYDRHYHYEITGWEEDTDSDEKMSLDKIYASATFKPIVKGTEHVFVTDKVIKAATCTEDGEATVKCEVCEYDKNGDTVVIPKTNHAFNEDKKEYADDGETVEKEYKYTAATCTKGSYEYGYCTNCEKWVTVNDATEALGHDWEITQGYVAPTCDTPGKTEGKKCVREGCDETVDSEEITASGHNYVIIPEKPATCTEPGYKQYIACEFCGALQSGDSIEVIEPEYQEHQNVVDIPATEATCTSPAMSVGKKCEACGVVTEAPVAIGKALDHDWVVDVQAAKPECEKDGCTEGKHCSRCTEVVSSETIAATGHTEVEIPATEATCEKAGMTAGKKCSVCEKELVAPAEDEEKPALGHDWIYEGEAKAATCSAPGQTAAKRCNRKGCGAFVAAQETAMLDHTYVIVEGKEDKAATCTENGLRAERVCSECEKAKLEEEVIPALGHVDNDNNNYCDRCNAMISDPSANCNHMCHSSGIKGLLWKLINALWKLLGVEQYCKCGVAHWTK